MNTPPVVLLDTSVIIDLGVVELADLATAVAVVSAISVAELSYGLDTPDPVQRHARTERFYAVLDQFEVVAFDTAAAKLYGTMASLVRRSGRDPRPRRLELQIAATAGAHSLPLLTRNPVDLAGLDRVLDVLSV